MSEEQQVTETVNTDNSPVITEKPAEKTVITKEMVDTATGKANEENTKPKPDGYEKVDFSQLPPEVEQRFNRVYGQMKSSFDANKILTQQIEEQSEAIDKLMSMVEGQKSDSTMNDLYARS